MAGHGNKVNVIAHQAPTQDTQSVPFRMFAQDFKISSAVFVREKYILPVVAALRDVVRHVGDNETGPTCHC
jgi:hypothetical protein